jgi:carboxymethylenebutenolidase
VSAASSLLAAIGAEQAQAGRAPAARQQATAPAISDATTPITFRGPGGRKLKGAWAKAARARGAVLVVHENRGLTDQIRSVASRLAASGYSALAIDLLSEEGGTSSFPDEGAAMAALYAVPTTRFVADMKAGVTELKRRLPGKKTAAMGFCFGGGMVWTLLAAKEPRLAAAAPFYGPFPEGSSLKGSRAAVLGIYGALDARVNASRQRTPHCARRDCRTSSSLFRVSTTPSSTTAAPGTTARPPTPPTSASSPGSSATWASQPTRSASVGA